MKVPSSAEIAYSIYGAWRLARLDAAGLGWVDASVDGVWKSFFAAVLVAPAYAVLVLLHIAESPPAADATSVFLIHVLAYAISWLAFPVIMASLAPLMDREAQLFRFIAAFNWIKVLQAVVYLPASLIAQTGLVGGLGSALVFLTALAILYYTWFTTRVALDVTGAAAAVLVFLDLVLGVLITVFADAAVA